MTKITIDLPDMPTTQALQIIRQVCDVHKCGSSERLLIEGALLVLANRERQARALEERLDIDLKNT